MVMLIWNHMLIQLDVVNVIIVYCVLYLVQHVVGTVKLLDVYHVQFRPWHLIISLTTGVLSLCYNQCYGMHIHVVVHALVRGLRLVNGRDRSQSFAMTIYGFGVSADHCIREGMIAMAQNDTKLAIQHMTHAICTLNFLRAQCPEVRLHINATSNCFLDITPSFMLLIHLCVHSNSSLH
jgi:hypothetical protein